MSPELAGRFFTTSAPSGKPKRLDIHMQKKMNQETKLTFFRKINSKFIIDLNVKHKTIKLLEDGMRKYRSP